MSDINLTFKHGRTQTEARECLTEVVAAVQQRFGSMVRQVEWSTDRNTVRVAGDAFDFTGKVDSLEVHIVGDIPLLGRMFAGPVTSGLKQIVDRTFQKQLSQPKSE